MSEMKARVALPSLQSAIDAHQRQKDTSQPASMSVPRVSKPKRAPRQAEKSSSEPTRASRRRSGAPSAAAKTSFSVPAACVDELRTRASESRRSQSDELLIQLHRFAQDATPRATTVGTFELGSRLRSPEPTTILTLRLAPANLQRIDQMVADLAYPTRSALVAAALGPQ